MHSSFFKKEQCTVNINMFICLFLYGYGIVNPLCGLLYKTICLKTLMGNWNMIIFVLCAAISDNLFQHTIVMFFTGGYYSIYIFSDDVTWLPFVDYFFEESSIFFFFSNCISKSIIKRLLWFKGYLFDWNECKQLFPFAHENDEDVYS